VQYRDLQTSDSASTTSSSVSSYQFDQLFLASAVYCNNGNDPRACQALANLCVLQKYELTSSACAAFQQIAATKVSILNGFSTWKSNMPLLYFPDDSILSSTALQMSVGFTSSTGVTNSLSFVLAKYTLNGTFLGTEPLALQLQLCQGQPSSQIQFLNFGTSYQLTCSLNLNALMAAYPASSTIFYDLFTVDAGGNLFPVPLKLLNYRVNGNLVNYVNGAENMVSGSIALQKRFFLVDSVSSQSSAGVSSVLVYANYIALRVNMQSGSTSRISPPYLVIQYAERQVEYLSTSTGATSSVKFMSSSSQSLTSFWLSVNVIFAMVVVLLGMVWIGRFYSSFRRYQLERFDMFALLRGIVMILSLSANFFFVFLVCVSFYCFIFFKLQSTAFFLLPAPDSTDYTLFRTLLVYTFFAKAIELFSMLIRQATADIFLIDWESPRSSDPESGIKKSSVSVWRKLFITNEWNDLQKEQSISIELTLFLILFFLRGLSLEYLATQQPSVTNLDSSAAPINIVLRFAVTTFFWLAICYAQLILQRLVYARFVHDQAANFVDLVSAANISVLVLDEPYHGYYIHGRTVHEHADTSMEEMREQLLKEQLGLVKPRGLSGDNEAFEVYFSRDFRTRYDEIFTTRLANDLAARTERKRDSSGAARQAPDAAGSLSTFAAASSNRDAVGSSVGAGTAGLNLPDPKTIAASNRLNDFLVEFVEKRGKLTWTEGLRNYCERFLDLPPAIAESGASLFYSDDEFSFKEVLMLGCERDWFIMSALFYAVLDLAFSNTFVSILVVFASNRLVSMLRSYFAAINISAKTLVDEKFFV
jgi:meckelin